MRHKKAQIKTWLVAVLSVVTLLVGFVAGYFIAAPSPSQPMTITVKETVTATVTLGPKYRIGLILSIGGLGDKGFNDAAYAGVTEAKEKLGIEFDLAQPRAIAEFEGLLRDFARTGKYDLIISVGFFQVDPLTVVAKEFPNQKFAIIDAVVDQPNVASLVYEEHEGAFLVGVIAGLMTKTGKVGFVGGLDIPLIKYRYVGWAEGVKWANPNAIIYERYVGAFDDPVKGKEIAIELITQGADVLFHVAGRSGLGVLDAAKEKNVFAQGSDQDQSWYAPNNVVASLLKGVQLSTFEIIKSIVDRNFRGGIHIYGLRNGGSDVAYGNMVPQEVKNKVEEARRLILEGKIKVTDIRK
jgi:basic membrane protein A